jgi:putative ABC transport system permease protein
MFRNYFKTAFRTLWKNKAYASINILGLAISIAGATLLLIYVQSELSFDQFHSKADRIVRPILIEKVAEGSRFYASNPGAYGIALANELPEVAMQASLTRMGGQFNVQIKDESFTERNYFFTNSNFFSVFDYELLEGDKATALTEPYSIVLSQRMAIKFFGTDDVMGKSIETPDSNAAHIVTGIMRDMPQNTHIEADILISEASIDEESWQATYGSWTSFSATSYILLKEGSSLEAFVEKAKEISRRNFPAQLNAVVDFKFQSLNDIHFESAEIERDIAAFKSDKNYAIIFGVISLFLIVIAAVNYMNLATSKAVFRAKEVGIRKVVGARKRQLVFQFLTESFLITLIALIVSIGLTDLTMPFFNDLTGRAFEFNWIVLQDYLPLLASIGFFIGLLSGVYPALIMTNMSAVKVLKGERAISGSFNIRKFLVVFQFVLSTILIIATLVVSNQMSLINNKDLGFNKENLLIIDINNGAVRPVFKTMRNEFANISGVTEVAVTSRVPGEWKNIHEVDVNVQGSQSGATDSIRSYYMSFDTHALSTFNMNLIEGAYFSGNDQNDSTKILINETAVKRFGLENPVGATLNLSGRRGGANYTIIGVIRDFNFQSLHTKMEPMVIGAWNNPNSIIDYFILKITSDPTPIIAAAELVHNKFDGETAMEYNFLDVRLNDFYQAEQQASIIFRVGAGLSIFIACLGLFGLASFTVQKRVKELGVRKVLGATEWNIFLLLSSSFTKQILLAFVIASPIAYYIMNNWLSNFEYRTSLGFGVFFVAGLSTLLISMITVSYRAIRAANSNPVNSLRSE